MKIAFFEVEKGDQDIFSKSLSGAEIAFIEGPLDETSVEKAKNAEAVCIFVHSAVNKNVLDALPNLKYIAVRATGYNNIDCEYAETKGIKISNVPAYGSHTVAEFAFGLILNLSRKIINSGNYIKESSDFNYFPYMEGFDLKGKTLGIIGTGKIGKNVAKIARGFEMNVIAYDLYPDIAFAKENNFTYQSLEEVVRQSDIITLHTPYTKENHHLINKENIAMMKKGVYLINTARGELIDTSALIAGLKDGTIAGAGLDVLEDEKGLKENSGSVAALNKELMKMQNVIVTPHVAFYTREALDAIVKVTIENIAGCISGNFINLVK